nr:hypothetical protein [Tanacetum cinerariifolium]
MHDDFVAIVYLKVHESLKHITKEHVYLENALSSSGTLSSMKNLEDNFTFSDQFINDKSMEEDSGKTNMETKVESMVTVPIHQASSSAPTLSTLLIDLTPPKHISFTKTSDTREALSSSSKQKSAPLVVQPVDDIPIPDVEHISDSKDTSVAHLLKIQTRLDRLKPILKEDRPKTHELDWVIPTNDLPKPKNNWADAISKSYKDPEENKLLRKTRDMGSFIKWYCRQIGKLKLSEADLEGSAFKVMPNVSKPLPLGGPPGQLMETEARMSREAWVRATDASNLVHGEVMSLRTTVLGQMSKIRELQAADRRRQTVISELLRIDHRRSTQISELRTALQGLVTALQGQVTALQA